MNPSVSILIPVYNVERYIVECLSSIINQSYSNFEVILVDDGSTDATPDVIRQVIGDDPRFTVISNRSNLGVAESLNRAYANSSGSFIARMDGDDVMHSDRLDVQLDYLSRYPDLDLLGTCVTIIDEKGGILRKVEKHSEPELVHRLLKYGPPVAHPTWMARRRVFDVVGGYRIPTVEDYDFLLRADVLGFKLGNVPNYFGHKLRIRRGNTASTQSYFQVRLHKYARKLHQQSQDGNVKVVDDAKVQRILGGGNSLGAAAYSLSTSLSVRASQESFAPKRIAIKAFALFLSPYRLEYAARSILKYFTILRWKMGR